MTTLHVIITGRVQGVGYRDWMVAEARRLGVAGWVRNRGPSDVEATIQGDDSNVRALLAACRNGPPHARVENISTQPCDALNTTTFTRFPST